MKGLSPDAFADLVLAAVQEFTRPLEKRVAALERRENGAKAASAETPSDPALLDRVSALERQTVKFRGVYKDTGIYTPGDATTRQGGLWVCVAATTGSFDHACWQLAVKKGDAR